MRKAYIEFERGFKVIDVMSLCVMVGVIGSIPVYNMIIEKHGSSLLSFTLWVGFTTIAVFATIAIAYIISIIIGRHYILISDKNECKTKSK